MLTAELLREVKDATRGKVTIALGLNSIDSDNAETRDVAPDRTLEVLRLCEELGINRHVIITIGKHNADTFEKTINYLVKERISFNRSPFVGRGSGFDYFKKNAFDRRDLKEKFHPVLRRHPIGYVSYTPFFLSPELHGEVSGGIVNGTVPHNPPVGCWVGTWIAVNAEGDVSVCPVLLDVLSAGNVRDKPLDRLVAGSELFERILDRGRLKGKCGRCRYQYTCGGCRAMAFFHTGDVLESDPTCFFEPVDRNTVSEHEEETNRMFRKYITVARYAGIYRRPQTRGPECPLGSAKKSGNGRLCIRPYRPGDERGMNDLYNRVFGKRRSLRGWYMKYQSYGPVSRFIASVAEREGKIVGMYPALVSFFQVGDREVLFGLPVDVCVDPDHRSSRLLQELKKCAAKLGIDSQLRGALLQLLQEPGTSVIRIYTDVHRESEKDFPVANLEK